jgi:phage gpG-like protein
MANISIKIDSRKFDRRLNILFKGLKDFKPPLEKSANYSVKIFKHNFGKSGAEFTKWQKLSPVTIREKIRLGFPTDILIRSGRLRDSFRMYKLTKTQTIIDNPVKYFKYHQLGGRRLPRRIMIDVNKRMKDTVGNFFHAYLKSLLKK